MMFRPVIRFRNFSFALLLSMTFAAGEASAIQFADVSQTAGINHSGPSWGAGAWGDFNGDGYPDLWVGNHANQPNLYQNNGNGTFTDVAPLVLVVNPSDDTHGAAWADFDSDGDQDLIEMVGAQRGNGVGPSHLFVNTGGMLVDQAVAYGVDQPTGRGRSPLWLDWNKDGRLDVLLTNSYRLGAPNSLFSQSPVRGAPFILETAASSGFDTLTGSSSYAQLGDLTCDGSSDLVVHNPKFPLAVYDMSVVPMADAKGVLGIGRTVGTQDTDLGDINGDLYSDIYMSRYWMDSDARVTGPNQVKAALHTFAGEKGFSFQSAGDITVNITGDAIWQISVGSTGVLLNPAVMPFTLLAADPYSQGIAVHVPGTDTSIYLGYDTPTQTWTLLSSSAPWRIYTITIDSTAPVSNVALIGFSQPPGEVDRILYSAGGAFIDTYADVPAWSKSVVTGDFDNDMDVDAYVVNTTSAVNLPNALFENIGGGVLINVPGGAGAGGTALGIGDSVSVADYDMDGRLDLFVTNGDTKAQFAGPQQLFRNTTVNTNHWIEIDLEGVSSNREGIGATIYATAGGVTQMRARNGGMHKYTQNHARIHFGLGPNPTVTTLRIEWPSGITQVLNNIPGDQLIHVVEPNAGTSKGMPVYQAGIDTGAYLWKDTFDGPYHLRLSSGAVPQVSTARVVTDGYSSAALAGLPWPGDVWMAGGNGFSLTTTVSNGENGVDFTLTPGSIALLSLVQDSYAYPRQLHTGLAGEPLAPVGWIFPSASLPVLPVLLPGQGGGLYLGTPDAGATVNARWDGVGGINHSSVFALFASHAIQVATPLNLEVNDRVISGPSREIVIGSVSANWDGVDVGLGTPADIGVVYRQDGIFQPHLARNIPQSQPNAYEIPQASPFGQPLYDPYTEAGIFVWKDVATGNLILSFTAGGGSARYVGSVDSDQPLVKGRGISLEPNDIVNMTNPLHVTFDVRTSGALTDGLGLMFPAGANVTVGLIHPATGGETLFRIGGEKWPLARLPLNLSGW